MRYEVAVYTICKLNTKSKLLDISSRLAYFILYGILLDPYVLFFKTIFYVISPDSTVFNIGLF